jgi:hypothetical protein
MKQNRHKHTKKSEIPIQINDSFVTYSFFFLSFSLLSFLFINTVSCLYINQEGLVYQSKKGENFYIRLE